MNDPELLSYILLIPQTITWHHIHHFRLDGYIKTAGTTKHKHQLNRTTREQNDSADLRQRQVNLTLLTLGVSTKSDPGIEPGFPDLSASGCPPWDKSQDVVELFPRQRFAKFREVPAGDCKTKVNLLKFHIFILQAQDAYPANAEEGGSYNYAQHKSPPFQGQRLRRWLYAVKWENRCQKWSTRGNFLHLETAKDIATKGEKLRPEHSSTIVQNFTPIGATVAEISVPDKRTLA